MSTCCFLMILWHSSGCDASVVGLSYHLYDAQHLVTKCSLTLRLGAAHIQQPASLLRLGCCTVLSRQPAYPLLREAE